MATTTGVRREKRNTEAKEHHVAADDNALEADGEELADAACKKTPSALIRTAGPVGQVGSHPKP